jgi:hypothetical protein
VKRFSRGDAERAEFKNEKQENTYSSVQTFDF